MPEVHSFTIITILQCWNSVLEKLNASEAAQLRLTPGSVDQEHKFLTTDTLSLYKKG